MGDVLELGAEFVAPATGYIKMIEDSGSKLYKVLRNSQEGKKIDPKDIDEVLEVLSDKGVGRRDFMAVVGGTSALALAKHIGIVDALKILEKAVQNVKPEGFLFYTVCTFTPDETQEVVKKFLKEKDFKISNLNNTSYKQFLEKTSTGSFIFLPKGDIFFISLLKK